MKIYNFLFRKFTHIWIKLHEHKFIVDGYIIRYIFKKKTKSSNLIVVFSGFNKGGARYNYIKTLKNNLSNQLYILDDGGYNNMGTYYLGFDTCWYDNNIIDKLIFFIESKTHIDKKYFIGTSKGGSAALIYGLKIQSDYIIIGSPQYKIYDYLMLSEEHKQTAFSIVYRKDKDFLNNIIKDSLSNYKGRIYLLYSSLEDSFNRDVKFLINDCHLNNTKLFLTDGLFANHSDVGFFFRNYLLNILSENEVD